VTDRDQLARLPQIALRQLGWSIDRPLERPPDQEPWSHLAHELIEDRLATLIAQLAGQLPKPPRLNRRGSPHLLADPVLDRVQLRPRRRALVPRRRPLYTAFATVSRANPNRVATSRCERPSTSTRRLISQSTPARRSHAPPRRSTRIKRGSRPGRTTPDSAPQVACFQPAQVAQVFTRRPQLWPARSSRSLRPGPRASQKRRNTRTSTSTRYSPTPAPRAMATRTWTSTTLARLRDALESLQRPVRGAQTPAATPRLDELLTDAAEDHPDERALDRLVRRVSLSMLKERATRQPTRVTRTPR
jgi:hypothetical protein